MTEDYSIRIQGYVEKVEGENKISVINLDFGIILHTENALMATTEAISILCEHVNISCTEFNLTAIDVNREC